MTHAPKNGTTFNLDHNGEQAEGDTGFTAIVVPTAKLADIAENPESAHYTEINGRQFVLMSAEALEEVGAMAEEVVQNTLGDQVDLRADFGPRGVEVMNPSSY